MLRSVALIAMLGLLSGCAIGLEHVDVAYKPMTAAWLVPGADRIPVEVLVNAPPSSSGRERVGAKKNGYGIEMGGIAATRPVAEIVGTAMAAELARRGFPIGVSGVKVAVDVVRFFNDFKTGFFSASTEADVTLAVTVRSGANSISYARTVTAKGDEDGLLLMTPDHAREALEAAFSKAVGQIVSDPAFIPSLFAASQNSPGVPPAYPPTLQPLPPAFLPSS